MRKTIWDQGCIRQLVPADGWYAVYKDESGRHKSRIGCWAFHGALDGDEEYDGISAMDNGELGLDRAEDNSNLEGFIHSSDPDFDKIPEWSYLTTFGGDTDDPASPATEEGRED